MKKNQESNSFNFRPTSTTSCSREKKMTTSDVETGCQGSATLVVAPNGEVISLPRTVQFDAGEIPHDSQPADENHHDPAMLRHISLELLNPTHDSDRRRSGQMVAMFNLVATVCGGGVLSLPLAFQRAGIIPTTILMVYAALTTDFSLYILVSCARRTGGRSYSDVAKAAFGNAAQVAISVVLFVHLFFTLIAYMVLVRDIWTPVLSFLLPNFILQPLMVPVRVTEVQQPYDEDNSYDTTISVGTDSSSEFEFQVSTDGANLILFCILIVGTPLLLARDLHALRHTCYVGFSSCALLMVAVVFRAYQAMNEDSDSSSSMDIQEEEDVYDTSQESIPRETQLNWCTDNIEDLIFAFPIVVLTFLCSYNVLGVHSSLFNPTRERMKCVLDSSMLLCCCLFYAVGLGGYIYALNDTSDNILLNFPLADPAILLGRMGYCFTLLFGLPLVTLPCREALLSIPGQIREWRDDDELTHKFLEVETRRKEGAHLVINGVDFDENEPLLVTDDPEQLHETMLTYGSVTDPDKTIVMGPHPKEDYLPMQVSDSPSAATTAEETERSSWVQKCASDEENNDFDQCEEECVWDMVMHCVSTFSIVGLCYFAAISVPGVAFVWSIVGSSMAILIGFIVPTSCYLKIRTHKRMNPRAFVSWILLIFSIIAATVCTEHTIASMSE